MVQVVLESKYVISVAYLVETITMSFVRISLDTVGFRTTLTVGRDDEKGQTEKDNHLCTVYTPD